MFCSKMNDILDKKNGYVKHYGKKVVQLNHGVLGCTCSYLSNWLSCVQNNVHKLHSINRYIYVLIGRCIQYKIKQYMYIYNICVYICKYVYTYIVEFQVR